MDPLRRVAEGELGPVAKMSFPVESAAAAQVQGEGEVRADFMESALLRTALPGVRHGFSYAWPRLDDRALAGAAGLVLGLDADVPWIFDQPHGCEVLQIGRPAVAETCERRRHRPARLPVASYDGAMARRQPGRVGPPGGPTVLIKAADCVSVLAVHPDLDAYAALHAGWRGTAAGILPRLLSAWSTAGGGLSRVRLAFGPHIRACCFEVRADCLAQFRGEDLEGAVVERERATYLDLERVLRSQAAVFGVGGAQIEALPHCTQCYRDAGGAYAFASYRRAQREGRQAGRNIAFIGPAR